MSMGCICNKFYFTSAAFDEHLESFAGTTASTKHGPLSALGARNKSKSLNDDDDGDDDDDEDNGGQADDGMHVVCRCIVRACK